MRWKSAILAGLALLLLTSGFAEAQVWRANNTFGRFVSVGTASTSYLLDGHPTVTRAYALRRLLTAYSTNKLINIVRASDSTVSDIGFTATGALDTATATTFCNATTCKVVTWYDQSGGGFNVTQGTDASRPALVFNCQGTTPCLQFTSGGITLASAGNLTPATGVMTLTAVVSRSSGTGACAFPRANGANNRLVTTSGSAQRSIIGGTSGSVIGAVTDAVFTATIGILNGASSLINNNGTVVSGTASGNTTAGTVQVLGAASTTCNALAALVFDNAALSASAQTAIILGEMAWWGL